MLCHSCHITYQLRAETIDVLTRKGHTRLLSTYPQQACIVHIQTLNADIICDKLFLVDVSWLYRLNLESVWIHSEQSQLVATYPDASGVSCHTVYVAVNTQSCHTKLLTYSIVPLALLAIIHHQSALSVQPYVVVLVGICTQRLCVVVLQCRYTLGHP